MTHPVTHADLANATYRAWTSFLARTDRWSLDEIQRFQLGEIRRILRHAFQNTDGYRASMENHGLDPDQIYSVAELRKLPIIEKETIRDNLDRFSAPAHQYPDRSYVTTGGSTGIPFGMYREPDAFFKELASKAHQYYRIGWREGDRQLVFRGLPVDSPDQMVFVPEFNELRCSSYHLTPERLEQYRQRAIDYQPEWIRCYPSSGFLVARWLLETGRPFPKIKGVLCASENLYSFQINAMREAFGGRVFSHYGHYELAVLAGYCERADTYHVLPQYGYTELLDHLGQPVTVPGQVGEIVGTSFLMHATPMIRYRTRDYAVLKSFGCSECGRPYEVWDRIEGRLQEFIVTGTGRLISMTAINSHDDIFDALQQFQFRQRTPGEVTIRYIPKSTHTVVDETSIAARLYPKLGSDIRLLFERVEDIPLTFRGKHRFLIQELSVEFHDGDLGPAWAMNDQQRKS